MNKKELLELFYKHKSIASIIRFFEKNSKDSRNHKIVRKYAAYCGFDLDNYNIRKAYEKNPKFCLYCNHPLPFIKGERLKFCNHSCAASYNNTNREVKESQKNKTSESLKKYNTKNKIFNTKNKEHFYCTVCRKKLCKCAKYGMCRECLNKNIPVELKLKFQDAGKKAAASQAEIKRSKNETLFCELCESYFKNVKHNEPIFNGWDADVIIEDIRMAILWNGKWHYESIAGHSVLQVQNRDRIKLKEIENAGYKSYVIKDMGKFNPDFVKQEFDKFIFYLIENQGNYDILINIKKRGLSLSR